MIVILFLILIWGSIIFFFWYTRPVVQKNHEIESLPKLQGHRGYIQDGPVENTLNSLISSRVLGLEMCEFDVRLTADGVPVLFHDQNLKRIYGVDREIQTITLEELKKVGSITSLREVLQSTQVAQSLNIEIKSSKIFNGPLIKAVMKEISEYGENKRILISSFNPFVLRLVAKFNGAKVLRALLVTEADEPGNRYFLKKMWLMRWSQCHMLNLDKAMINKGRMLYFKNLNIPIAAWTVNDVNQARELFEMGVASVITDKLKPQDFELAK